MKPYKALIFDWDGTLADSTSQIIDSLNYAFQKLNLPLPERKKSQSMIGLPLKESISELYPNYDEQLLIDLVALYREHFFSYWQ